MLISFDLDRIFPWNFPCLPCLPFLGFLHFYLATLCYARLFPVCCQLIWPRSTRNLFQVFSTGYYGNCCKAFMNLLKSFNRGNLNTISLLENFIDKMSQLICFDKVRTDTTMINAGKVKSVSRGNQIATHLMFKVKFLILSTYEYLFKIVENISFHHYKQLFLNIFVFCVFSWHDYMIQDQFLRLMMVLYKGQPLKAPTANAASLPIFGKGWTPSNVNLCKTLQKNR